MHMPTCCSCTCDPGALPPVTFCCCMRAHQHTPLPNLTEHLILKPNTAPVAPAHTLHVCEPRPSSPCRRPTPRTALSCAPALCQPLPSAPAAAQRPHTCIVAAEGSATHACLWSVAAPTSGDLSLPFLAHRSLHAVQAPCTCAGFAHASDTQQHSHVVPQPMCAHARAPTFAEPA